MAAYPSRPYAWTVVAILIATAVLSYADRQVLSLLARRNLIFTGVSVWSLGTIACDLSNNFGEIFASRIVVGLGEAALSPAAISLISDYFPPSRRGTAVGLFLSGIAMGSGAAILIGGGALHAIELGALAATPLATYALWRMVLLLIGGP
ncbi:MAG: MFS transporter, partial [Steroidobacteraceae bacterium]